jgi:hypothetical protein
MEHINDARLLAAKSEYDKLISMLEDIKTQDSYEVFKSELEKHQNLIDMML